jgi:hypothetical protein
MSLEARINKFEKSVNESNDAPCPHGAVVMRYADDPPLPADLPPCEHGCTGARLILTIHCDGVNRPTEPDMWESPASRAIAVREHAQAI